MSKPDVFDIVCAVDQGFAIDPKHQPLIEEALRQGLIQPLNYWTVTEKGQKFIEPAPTPADQPTPAAKDHTQK